MKLHNYIHNILGFSEYEIAQMQYLVYSIFSEISKLLLIGTFFVLINKFSLFLVAAFVLCILRICTGGIHFSHYVSCLTMSFAIFFVGVCILCDTPVAKPLQLVILTLCIIINYICAPVVSAFRPIPDGIRIQKSKRQSIKIITLFSIILFILPQNQYINVGFWMIILQAIQLLAARLLRKEDYRNETTDNVFSN